MSSDLSESAISVIRTARPARWAKQLVSHWGRHGQVTTVDGVDTMAFEATQGRSASVVRVESSSTDLIITAWTDSSAALDTLCEAIAEHLHRFAGDQETLAIEWRRPAL